MWEEIREEEGRGEDGDTEGRQGTSSHPVNGECTKPTELAQIDQKVHDVGCTERQCATG